MCGETPGNTGDHAITEKVKAMTESKTTAKTTAKKAEAKTAAFPSTPAFDTAAFEAASDILRELTRTNYEESVETARAIMTSGNLKTAMDLQSDYIRAAMKRNMDAARELNELTVSAVKDVMAPYTEKFNETIEKMKAA